MPRRFSKRRTLVIASITVALSIGIVFASVPYFPHPPPPHGSIKFPVTRGIAGGNQTHPGFFALSLPGVFDNQSFAVRVTVLGGALNFCVLQQSTYDNWLLFYYTTANPGSTFPSGACIPQEQRGIVQTVLSFTPPSTGNYDVAALNTNPQNATITFSPA